MWINLTYLRCRKHWPFLCVTSTTKGHCVLKWKVSFSYLLLNHHHHLPISVMMKTTHKIGFCSIVTNIREKDRYTVWLLAYTVRMYFVSKRYFIIHSLLFLSFSAFPICNQFRKLALWKNVENITCEEKIITMVLSYNWPQVDTLYLSNALHFLGHLIFQTTILIAPIIID